MSREPGYGELIGRMDDLESSLEGLKRAVAVLLVAGFVLWLESRQPKEVKGVD